MWPVFGVYKGVLVVVKRGCTLIESPKLKSVISSKKCDDILDYEEVLRDFL